MVATSAYIYYPSGTPGVGAAFDLRYCCTATRVGGEAHVRFVGMVNEVVVFSDWSDFYSFWRDAINPPPAGFSLFRVLDPAGLAHEDFDVEVPAGGSYEDFFVEIP